MNGKSMTMILSVGLLMPGLVAAQQAEPVRVQPGSPGQRTQIYEDIEVLRRLLSSKLESQYAPVKTLVHVRLERNCASCHGNVGHLTGTIGQPQQDWLSDNHLNGGNALNSKYLFGLAGQDNHPFSVMADPPSNHLALQVREETNNSLFGIGQTGTLEHIFHTSVPLLDTEGVYLKNLGVLYTLSLPPPPQPPRLEPIQPPPRPVSDWERFRREVRNEKSEPREKEPAPKAPTLPEILLRVLAESGQHFGYLADHESLTAVVTFRPEAAAAAHFLGTTHRATRVQGLKPVNSLPARATDASYQHPWVNERNLDINGKNDYELLADLYLKQAKFEDAVRAFDQALGEQRDPKKAVSLYRKLAQAYLGKGQDEEARKALDRAIEIAKTATATPVKPPTQAQKTPSPLPAKLVVSASKRLLDSVGKGTISFEEFAKAAQVEYLNFPAPQD